MIDISKLTYLKEIDRVLNNDNIDEMIEKYKMLLQQGPLKIEGHQTPYAFLKAIKREKLTTGPYPGVSLFEAANRIMSDLVILYGVKSLLKEEFDGVKFTEFEVCFGNEDHEPHDVNAKSGEYQLAGEAFNVAESFFYLKKRASLDKLFKKETSDKRLMVLLYNDDATKKNFPPDGNLFHWPVSVDL